MSLPASTKHWEADSGQAWAALSPWSASSPTTFCFREGFDDFLAAASPPPQDDFQRMIFIHALCSHARELKEMKFKPGSKYLSDPSTLSENAASVQAALDRFNDSAILESGHISDATRDMRVQQTSIVLLSPPVSAAFAADIASLMHIMWARRPKAQTAYEFLRRWAIESSDELRTVVHACVQVLSFLRRYPCNHPRESTVAFHAGFALWSMVELLLPSQFAAAKSPEAGHREVVNLDWNGAPDAPQAIAVQCWRKNGGNQILRMHGVPNLICHEGSQQVLVQTAEILDCMAVWGITHKFRNAVLRVLHSDDARPWRTSSVRPRRPYAVST